MGIKEFLASQTSKRLLMAVGLLLIIIGAFEAGEMVGYRRADFSSRWGENYFRNFAGPERGPLENFEGGRFLFGHGIGGPILRISSSTIVIQDRDGAEKVLQTDQTTDIRRFRDRIQVSDLKTGDMIVVLGEPDSQGAIRARLIRVIPEIPGIPTSTVSSTVR